MHATLVAKAFHRPGWVYEEKYDGWRMLAYGYPAIGTACQWVASRPVQISHVPALVAMNRMRAHVGKVLGGSARLLRAGVRSLGLRQRSYRPGREYWEWRARRFGIRAVLNLGHVDSDVHRITEFQKRELFPHLTDALRGDERLLVDFGCGPGRFTVDLASLIGGQVLGLDIIERFLEIAPRSSQVAYQHMVEGRVDLPDGWADVVWVCLVLGGIRDQTLDDTVREITRILKLGGLLFLVENTSSQPDAEHWTFRTVDAYCAMFSTVALRHVHDYADLGERFSVMVGRKQS
jgi:SAM-dependent methyltransferase